MLQLTRNSVNTLSATFQDNEIAGNGTTYMIGFTSLNQEADYVIPIILSDTTRSTQFTIELNATEDAANGVIQLVSGHYDVNVYRQTSATNLDPLDASVDGIIFTCEAFIELATGESAPIYYSNTIATATYYERV